MSKDKDYKFIKTQDEHTKEVLISLGYQMISNDGKTTTFINDSKLYFDKAQLKNTTLSNKLEF